MSQKNYSTTDTNINILRGIKKYDECIYICIRLREETTNTKALYMGRKMKEAKTIIALK